jgi:hypothetical protein
MLCLMTRYVAFLRAVGSPITMPNVNTARRLAAKYCTG